MPLWCDKWKIIAKFARNKFLGNICHHLLQIKL